MRYSTLHFVLLFKALPSPSVLNLRPELLFCKGLLIWTCFRFCFDSIFLNSLAEKRAKTRQKNQGLFFVIQNILLLTCLYFVMRAGAGADALRLSSARFIFSDALGGLLGPAPHRRPRHAPRLQDHMRRWRSTRKSKLGGEWRCALRVKHKTTPAASHHAAPSQAHHPPPPNPHTSGLNPGTAPPPASTGHRAESPSACCTGCWAQAR
jgi:hypothetical protein